MMGHGYNVHVDLHIGYNLLGCMDLEFLHRKPWLKKIQNKLFLKISDMTGTVRFNN